MFRGTCQGRCATAHQSKWTKAPVSEDLPRQTCPPHLNVPMRRGLGKDRGRSTVNVTGILAKGSRKEKVCRERTFRALMAALP